MAFINNYNKNKMIKMWLILSLFLVSSMIVIGGLTRLTNSGLSITQWEVFTGILPPLNNNEWIKYFNLYKEIPQFILLNDQMNLSEFKVIFYWEYFHRLFGRIIGLFFLIPLIFFTIYRYVNKKTLSNFYIIFMLILLQGLIGWYMVKSGLINNVSVSHYRLSLHLIVAFIILSSIFWNYLNINKSTSKVFFNFSKKYFIFKIFIILIFIQIIFGAFVSGLDAGNIYQTWPLMNENYFPDDVKINNFQDIFNFKDVSLVQFFHRNIAYLIFFIYISFGFTLIKNKYIFYNKSYLIVLSVIFLQIILGILTLISGLNILVASMHQISSILLVFSSLHFYHNLSVKK